VKWEERYLEAWLKLRDAVLVLTGRLGDRIGETIDSGLTRDNGQEFLDMAELHDLLMKAYRHADAVLREADPPPRGAG